MSNNMRIWSAVETTDPKYTKKVEFGRKFTSINAMYQFKRMTEQFGPVGEGWGYRATHSSERIRDDMVYALSDVTVWWRGEEGREHSYGPLRGMAAIVEKSNAGKVLDDDDAWKKATTDALTKGLSHLGLSADVFLGLYDDNKYIQKVTAQFNKAEPAKEYPADPDVGAATKRWCGDAIHYLDDMADIEGTKTWKAKYDAQLVKLEKTYPELYADVMKAFWRAVDRTKREAA